MNWWTICCTNAYAEEFSRLWELHPDIRQKLSVFEVELQRRDLEAWLARTAEARGTHLWIVRHEETLEMMLECYPEDCVVRLIWPRLVKRDSTAE